MSKENITVFRDEEHFEEYLKKHKPKKIYCKGEKPKLYYSGLTYTNTKQGFFINGTYVYHYFKQGMYVKHKD